MSTRRQFIQGGIAMAASCAGQRLHATPPPFRLSSPGCCISAYEFNGVLNGRPTTSSYVNGADDVLAWSGNSEFDRALAKSLSRISALFGVLPGFSYYDDSNEGPLGNARASKETRLGREDGTVIFGQTIFQQHVSQPNGDAAILAVCAHEFGHIAQYKNGIDNILVPPSGAVRLLELHADFLAGYFAAVRKHENPNFAAIEFKTMIGSFGDTSTDISKHHGTSQERAYAVSEGAGAFKVRSLNFDDALKFGVNVVRNI